MKTFTLLALVACAGFACSQDLSKQVSFRHVAAPLGMLLADLSSQTGIPVAAGDDVKREVLIVNAKNVTAKELLEQMCFTLDAGIKIERGKVFITRTPQQEQAREKRNAEARIEDYRKIIDKQKELAAKYQPLDEKSAAGLAARQVALKTKYPDPYSGDYNAFNREYKGLSDQMPLTKAISLFASLLDPAAIAAVPDEYKVVFSSKPNKLQLQLPSVDGALSKVMADQNAFGAAVTKLGGGPKPDAPWPLDEAAKAFSGPPAKIVLTITRPMFGSSPQVAIIFADERGRYIQNSGGQLGTDEQQAFNNLIKPAKDKQSKPLQLSSISKKFVDYMKSGMRSNGNMPSISDTELRTFLLNPEKHDPLELVVSDAVLQAAEESGKPTILHGQDMLLLIGGISATAEVPASALLDRMLPLSDLEKVDRAGWQVFRHRHPMDTAPKNVDREALGTLVRLEEAKKRMSIEDFAVFQSMSDVPFARTFAPYYFLLLMPDEFYASNLAQVDSEGFLQLFGTLTSDQRKAASQEAGITFSHLSERQQKIVEKMVFGNSPHIDYMNDPDPNTSVYGTLMMEPTEAFPNGIPDSARFRFAISSAPAVFGKANSPGSEGSRAMLEIVQPSEIASSMIAKETRNAPSFASRTFSDFVQGTSAEYSFGLELSQKVSLSETLKDNQWNKEAKPLRYEQLPDSFRKEVAEAIARYREMAKQGIPLFGGTGAKPVKPPLS